MTRAAFLPVDQPLDLDVALDSGQSFRWRRDAGGWLGVLEGVAFRLSWREAGVAAEAGSGAPADLEGYLASYFRLEDDVGQVQARLSRDAHVAQGIAAFPGMRILRQDPWEVLAGFILSSTSNIPRIARTMELLARTLGRPVRVGEAERHAFPSAEEVAGAGEPRLRELGCGFRAPYLAAAAAAVASGSLPLHALRGAPYDDCLAALTELTGIGEKIADCVMLFALDRMEAFPVDRWVHRSLVDWYGLAPRFRYGELREWARDRFGADAGYANQYLFWHIRQSTRPMIAAGVTKPLPGPRAPAAGHRGRPPRRRS